MKSIFHALNRLKVFRGLTEQEFAWVLYDVGNSAFTMLSCSLIPIWFKSLAIGTAPGQINSHQATAYYSIAVAVVTVIVALLGPIFGVLPDILSKGIGFTVTAVWWLLVTIPLIRGFKQRNYVETEGHDIRKAFAKIFHTLKNIATHDKKVLFFLIAFFLYIDGVGTIIDNAINIGTDLNLNTVGQVVFLLATQVVAFGGSLVFAKLSKKCNTVTLILVCIAGYFGIALYALMLSSLLHFAILAFFIGCFQGSIQSLSRSYYSKIIPAENSGEYFGIYDIFSKGASFLGSAVIAAVKLAGGTINVAVACLAVFFALGFLFLRIADKQKAIR